MTETTAMVDNAGVLMTDKAHYMKGKNDFVPHVKCIDSKDHESPACQALWDLPGKDVDIVGGTRQGGIISNK